MKIIEMKRKPHSIILNVLNLCDIDKIINEYLISIVGQEYKDKVINKKYYDLIYIDCSSESLKKENVDMIIEKFSKSGLEKIQKKFYVIKNIENSTPNSINALLKNLEEPEKDLYAILTTSNINSVLETIKSRCQIFNIHSTNKEINELLKQLNIEDKDLVTSIYSDISTLKRDIDNEFLNESISFVETLLNNKNNTAKIYELSQIFKKKSYYDISLIIKILIYKTNSNLFNILSNLKFNPSKILVYNQIIKNI